MLIRTPCLVDGHGVRSGDLALAVQRDATTATITDIGSVATLAARSPGAQLMRAEAVCTRFVNAHTHLDLTAYPALALDFPQFIAAMTEHRRAAPRARGLPAASRGLAQLLAQRVVAVGDIVAREPVMVAELSRSPVAGVAYWELVCTDQAAAAATLAQLAQRLQTWRSLQRAHGPRLGLSPQSPYLVCKDVLRELARRSLAEGIPLQIHVAESASEIEFFRSGGGALAEVLARSGFRTPPTPASLGFRADPGLTPVRYLAEIGFLDASPTLVHCVHVSDEDIRIIAQHGCAVVTCPRSNLHLNCGVFPWQKFVLAGVPVALATDSTASAHSLDMRAELATAFAAFGPEFRLPMALDWLTNGGSRALGMQAPRIERGHSLDSVTTIHLQPATAA